MTDTDEQITAALRLARNILTGSDRTPVESRESIGTAKTDQEYDRLEKIISRAAGAIR
jgi:hypothetical protein